MQEEMRCLAERLRAEKGTNLRVPVGANVGEVVAGSIQTGEGQVEYTPIGHSISLPSHLQTLANPSLIAINYNLRKLVEGHFFAEMAGAGGRSPNLPFYPASSRSRSWANPQGHRFAAGIDGHDNWFAKSFELTELQDAQALLDEL